MAVSQENGVRDADTILRTMASSLYRNGFWASRGPSPTIPRKDHQPMLQVTHSTPKSRNDPIC